MAQSGMLDARELWRDKCAAAVKVRERHGVGAAFDYIVGEKLEIFAETAVQDPGYARELPAFVAEVRRLFTWEEIVENLARLERQLGEQADTVGTDDPFDEKPESFQARIERFRTIAELLRAQHLGTS